MMRSLRAPIALVIVASANAFITEALAAPAQHDDPAEPMEAVAIDGHARITVLSASLIRLEWSPDRAFEDRPSLLARNRNLSPPQFAITRINAELRVQTRRFLLRYRDDGRPFHAENLSVLFNRGGTAVRWIPDQPNAQNFGGTWSDLVPVGSPPFSAGLLSGDGWTLIDDSKTPLIGGDGRPMARRTDGALDWYLVVYDREFGEALTDFGHLLGGVWLPPRTMMGVCIQSPDSGGVLPEELAAALSTAGLPADLARFDAVTSSDSACAFELLRVQNTAGPDHARPTVLAAPAKQPVAPGAIIDGGFITSWADLAEAPSRLAAAANSFEPFCSLRLSWETTQIDPELFTRSLQLLLVSPVLRLETAEIAPIAKLLSTSSDRPNPVVDVLRLRTELVPYFYGVARRCHETSMPPLRPLYFAGPDFPEAFERSNEWLLGESLLAAPITFPSMGPSGCAQSRIWLPPGEWTHWFTGRTYRGPQMLALATPLHHIPLFVPAGALIPAARFSTPASSWPDPLILHVWPGPRTTVRHYDDDGRTVAYRRNQCTWISLSAQRFGRMLEVTIDPREGQFESVPEERRFEIVLHDLAPPVDVYINGKRVERTIAADDNPGWYYNPAAFSIVGRTGARKGDESTTIRVELAENAAFEHALRNGLREAVTVASEFVSLHPNASKSAQRFAAIGHHAADDVEAAGADAAKFREMIAALAAEILTSGLPTGKACELAVRLLGLTYEAGAVESNGPKRRVPIHITIDPLLDPKEGLTVRLVCDELVSSTGIQSLTVNPASRPAAPSDRADAISLEWVSGETGENAFVTVLARITSLDAEVELPILEIPLR